MSGVAQLLLDYGSSVNAKRKDGGTGLHIAAVRGDFEMAELLIDRKAEVDAGSTWMPLHAAAYWGHKDIVALLIKHEAKINATMRGCHRSLENQPRKVEMTIPDIAVEKGYTETVELLVDKGADVTIKDEKGKTPLDLAREHKRPSIIKLLDG